MIKVKALEQFRLGERFDKIKNIQRFNESNNDKNRIYMGDTFECDEGIAKYLTNEIEGGNPENRAVVEVIEIVPEVKEKVEEKKEVKKTSIKRKKAL